MRFITFALTLLISFFAMASVKNTCATVIAANATLQDRDGEALKPSPSLSLGSQSNGNVLLPVGVLRAAGAVLGSIDWISILSAVGTLLQSSNEEREKFTKVTIAQLRGEAPEFNYIICHVAHKTRFYGRENDDYAITRKELDLTFSKNVWYNVYAFRAGEFELVGDGGNINWLYAGNATYRTADNRRFNFSVPQTNIATPVANLTVPEGWNTVNSGPETPGVSWGLMVATLVAAGLLSISEA